MLTYISRALPHYFVSINNWNYYRDLPKYYSFDTICATDDPMLINIFHSTYMKYTLNKIAYELYQDIPMLEGGVICHKLGYPLVKIETYRKCKRSADVLNLLSDWIYCYSNNKLLGELSNYM